MAPPACVAGAPPHRPRRAAGLIRGWSRFYRGAARVMMIKSCSDGGKGNRPIVRRRRRPAAPAMMAALFAATVATAPAATAARSAAVVPRRPPALSMFVVAVASDATAAEQEAAAELASMVGQLVRTPGALRIVTPAAAAGKPQLAVGAAAAAAVGIAREDLLFEALGAEGFVATSNRTAALRASGSYALSGAPNSTSGTLYACYHLLRAFGVRFLAWDETMLPAAVPSPLPALDRTFLPAFEYRDVDGWAALSHPQQASYFHMNGAAQASSSSSIAFDGERIRAGVGDRAVRVSSGRRSPYATPPGFVHTSYALFDGDTDGKFNCTDGHCPPLSMWKEHREWFYPHDDPSVSAAASWPNDCVRCSCASALLCILLIRKSTPLLCPPSHSGLRAVVLDEPVVG
eukprot:SAG31_NODE_2654_length_5292_cov_2.266898_2_plen_403_part_00